MALLYPLVYGILRRCLRVNNDCGLDGEAMGEDEVDGGVGDKGGKKNGCILGDVCGRNQFLGCRILQYHHLEILLCSILLLGHMQ